MTRVSFRDTPGSRFMISEKQTRKCRERLPTVYQSMYKEVGAHLRHQVISSGCIQLAKVFMDAMKQGVCQWRHPPYGIDKDYG